MWRYYVGNKFYSRCYCCNKEPISVKNFDCGHVISEKNGGNVCTENMRPICRSCNTSMGTVHMEEYMKNYGYIKNNNWNGYNIDNDDDTSSDIANKLCNVISKNMEYDNFKCTFSNLIKYIQNKKYDRVENYLKLFLQYYYHIDGFLIYYLEILHNILDCDDIIIKNNKSIRDFISCMCRHFRGHYYNRWLKKKYEHVCKDIIVCMVDILLNTLEKKIDENNIYINISKLFSFIIPLSNKNENAIIYKCLTTYINRYNYDDTRNNLINYVKYFVITDILFIYTIDIFEC